MELEYHTIDGSIYAELKGPAHCIQDTQDMLDLIATANYYRGASGIIINETHLPVDFFDLRTGLAGELLQKCSNYRFNLAITGDFSNVKSRSLCDFIRESNQTGRVLFVSEIREAVKKWVR